MILTKQITLAHYDANPDTKIKKATVAVVLAPIILRGQFNSKPYLQTNELFDIVDSVVSINDKANYTYDSKNKILYSTHTIGVICKNISQN